MANRNIYVGPRQDAAWQRAEEIAGQEGVSLGSFVHRAIRREIERVESEGGPTTTIAEMVIELKRVGVIPVTEPSPMMEEIRKQAEAFERVFAPAIEQLGRLEKLFSEVGNTMAARHVGGAED